MFGWNHCHLTTNPSQLKVIRTYTSFSDEEPMRNKWVWIISALTANFIHFMTRSQVRIRTLMSIFDIILPAPTITADFYISIPSQNHDCQSEYFCNARWWDAKNDMKCLIYSHIGLFFIAYIFTDTRNCVGTGTTISGATGEDLGDQWYAKIE